MIGGVLKSANETLSQSTVNCMLFLCSRACNGLLQALQNKKDTNIINGKKHTKDLCGVKS